MNMWTDSVVTIRRGDERDAALDLNEWATSGVYRMVALTRE